MATKRSIKMKTGKRGKGKTKAELKRLLKDAQGEVDKLLKADQAENLTRASLKGKLHRIKRDLKKIEPFEGGGT